MKHIIFLSISTGFAFLLFIAVLITAIIKKKKALWLSAVMLFVLFASLLGFTGYTLASKTYNKVAGAVKPRTGDEIYDALFGKRQIDCVKVIHSQDQVVPKIDYAIWLYFETCPGELGRLLKRHDFSMTRIPAERLNAAIPLGDSVPWFKPESMGGAITVYEYATDDSRGIQTFWVSADSTQVYCRDIWD